MEAAAVRETDRGGERFNWRIFGVLVGLLSLGYVAIIPYSLTLGANSLKTLTPQVPLPVLIAAQTLQGILLYSILAGIGLFAAGRIGLGTPILRKWIEAHPVRDDVRRIVRPALLVGVVGSLTVLATEAYIFTPLLSRDLAQIGIPMPATLTPPAWQGLLASLYGAFDEEVVMRLFLLTVLAWLGSRIWKSGTRRPSPAVLWTANILASVLFGLGHLPATAAAGLPIDSIVIARAVVLNGLLGVGFGWLYFTDGLESAMLAHFSADIMIHVIVPLLAII
jgi:hypothetical protein